MEQEGGGKDVGLQVWGEGVSEFLSTGSLYSIRRGLVLRVSRSQESRGLESWQRVCQQMTGKQGKGQSGLESDT